MEENKKLLQAMEGLKALFDLTDKRESDQKALISGIITALKSLADEVANQDKRIRELEEILASSEDDGHPTGGAWPA